MKVVQISRTMMFMWVFSLPFAIASDSSSTLAHMLCVFFMTYAFFGLEDMSKQLEDPFGHDDNDFDNLGLARSVMEDVFAIIDIVDGTDMALKVRDNMMAGDTDRRFSIHKESTPLLGA